MTIGNRSTLRHGHARHNVKSAEYMVWQGIKARCINKKSKGYRYYGARGIRVCDRWLSFDNFLADMGKKPRPGRDCSIERIDTNGDYSPENCKWATLKEQHANKKNTVRLTFNGETLSLPEWALKLGIKRTTLATRLFKGWTVERTLTTMPIPRKRFSK